MKKIILYSIGTIVLLVILGNILGWFGEATQVAQKEFGANASLKKYEWFINQEGYIKKMDAEISLLQEKQEIVKNQYNTDYGKIETWDLVTKNNYQKEISISREQLTATTTQRNKLASEYNAQSEKFNWKPYESHKDKPKELFETIK